MMTDNVPDEAERLILSNYTSRAPQAASRFVQGLRVERPEVFTCPACFVKQDVPEHGEKDGCVNCNLKWIVYGNNLHIWKEA